jgi:hypothetical protein
MRIASGALGKTIVFGLLKRGDKVYTEIVSDCSVATLQSIIKGKASIDSVIHLLAIIKSKFTFFKV